MYMSCLFNSLSYYEKNDSPTIRAHICDYLQTDPMLYDVKASDWVKWEKNLDLNSYVTQMRSHSTWGGAMEIRSYVTLYNKRVLVHYRNREIEFPCTGGTEGTETIHLYYTGGHYEPK